MITIRQIAQEAGVSTATVARVFGNHPNVKAGLPLLRAALSLALPVYIDKPLASTEDEVRSFMHWPGNGRFP